MPTVPDITVILPCRNEQEALGGCITSIKRVCQDARLSVQIIVSDSSSDRSPLIAQEHGVDLVKHDKVGYGIAYLEAYPLVKSSYIFMADADGTYDFHEIPRFLHHLRSGADFVIGDRFCHKMQKGSMPFMHKYVGNPFLSGMLRLFFGRGVKDAHCGMRAITKSALERLDLCTTGMEFASEMVVKALRANLKIKQVPISYRRRIGESKLSALSDGWRHLRFMLLYSPKFLFLIPGLFFFFFGFIGMLWLLISPVTLFSVTFFVHPLFFLALFMIVGYQLMHFGLFAITYATLYLRESSQFVNRFFSIFTLEKALILGGTLIFIGCIMYGFIVVSWIQQGFGNLQQVKTGIAALTFAVLGVQTIFSSFMLSMLSIRRRE